LSSSWPIWGAFALWQLASLGQVPPVSAQEVWFSPLEPSGPDATGRVTGSRDYMDLFEPGASWTRAAGLTSVFLIGDRFAVYTPEGEIRRVIEGLKARGIGLAVGIGALSGSAQCGFHVEGYSAPGEPITIAMRLKRLGADLQYIDLDEPLAYGHYYHGPNACQSPIDAIAEDVAAKVKAIRSVYPNIKVVESEPITTYPGAEWLDSIDQWLTAYQRAAGQPLGALVMDLDWRLDWQGRIRLVRPLLKKHGVSLGVIFNGDGDSKSDKGWLDAAASRYEAYVHLFGGPDQVNFSSWMPHPTHVLPETDPTAFTNVIVRYGQLSGRDAR